jgi:predicted ATP-grasp superfamily ATP-dependent carboligase
MAITVLVTDGDQRPALAIVRALGRRGASVVVAEEHGASLASASKYCARRVTYPSPYRQREAFDAFLLDFVKRERPDVVLPVTDVTTHAICLNQEALRPYCGISVPRFEAFDFVTDKWRLLESAQRSGVPVPRTIFVDGRAGLEQHKDQVEYPAVVKPVRSRIPTDRGWLSAGVQYAESEAELDRLFEQTEYLASYPSLVQERIVGPGVGVFVLFDRGRLVADFAHRRLREKPPAGGVSVLRESIPVDPALREHAVRLLGPIGWHGVAMMEFKQDQRTGNFFLMEVNGRFWGSLQLAVDAGVDFPSLACELALGCRREVAATYKVGVKSRWLLGDLDHLLLRLFKSDRQLNLPGFAPSRLRTLVDFLKLVQPDVRYEVVSRDDPRPFVHELRQSATALLDSAARVVRQRAGLVGPAPTAGPAMVPTAQMIPAVQGPPCLEPKVRC